MTTLIKKVDTDGTIITVAPPKRLTVYLQGDTWEKLQRLSSYFGLSVSQMVSSQTKRSFLKHKKSIEIVEEYSPPSTREINEGEKES